jgi:hypothetical protein
VCACVHIYITLFLRGADRTSLPAKFITIDIIRPLVYIITVLTSSMTRHSTISCNKEASPRQANMLKTKAMKCRNLHSPSTEVDSWNCFNLANPCCTLDLHRVVKEGNISKRGMFVVTSCLARGGSGLHHAVGSTVARLDRTKSQQNLDARAYKNSLNPSL